MPVLDALVTPLANAVKLYTAAEAAEAAEAGRRESDTRVGPVIQKD